MAIYRKNKQPKTHKALKGNLLGGYRDFTYLARILNKLIFKVMERGKVKFFNEAKGYGFIIEDETNREIFIHHSGLIDKVRENDVVTYDVIEGRKGLNAVQVKKVQ
mgnify:CR=1 FL=1